ncbi:hypothetical protein SSP35_19_01300 [Streptomyces sp. NBRC 110611]|uniref:hypothetical protein n=1 Tax=Streptomyces sp. NBRC 110611 TaxID=1621259 RepID=UPI0008330088|nr:hypothetical protein [Streptomyces sp. NBRC 110611]GAU70492.1 hypothetical protein SSP35_19_01300 [Streptomyces sp. NBRC 110611]
MDTTENIHDQDDHNEPDGKPATSSAESPALDGGQSDQEGYRQALEKTHSRLETAQKRIDAMLLREIERQAAQRLDVPSDLFDLGKHQIADLLGEDGDVDAEKVSAAVDSLLKSRPNLAARPTGWGDVGGGSRSSSNDDTPDWKTALRGHQG